MKDKRSYEIKTVLKKYYPEAIFRVKIDKYSMGESINIKTDLKKEYPDDVDFRNLTPECLAIKEHNEKITQEIETLLKDFWHLDRDPITGEILAGGNTYLFVDSL